MIKRIGQLLLIVLCAAVAGGQTARKQKPVQKPVRKAAAIQATPISIEIADIPTTAVGKMTTETERALLLRSKAIEAEVAQHAAMRQQEQREQDKANEKAQQKRDAEKSRKDFLNWASGGRGFEVGP